MFKKLKLRQKFTIFLVLIVILGLIVSGFALSTVLRQNAKHEIAAKALTLIDTITATREYSNSRITPELSEQLETKFLPQSISAFAAREVFEIFRKEPNYKDFLYKEATLNPTNPRDKADIFETAIVEQFRQENNFKELSGFRSGPRGDFFYIARPLIVSQSGCLKCHGKVEDAPKTMIDIYGTTGGFGWKLNEIVGAQILSIPASRIIQKAQKSSALILLIVFVVFISLLLVVNLFLNHQVIHPLKRLTRVAQEISTGHMDVDFEAQSNDEIGSLAKALKRMKYSLEMAMKRLQGSSGSQGS
ncbi:MAG: DUF3365 domain-containing protein [Nostocaceae cyanobacterium]|nr:DUF3365 domain-containing protein [Nostocaceae cyanobacterium]